MPGSLVLQIRGTDSWKANTVISQLHFELLAQTEALHRCWSLSRWAVLKEITGHTKPSPLLLLSAHKNEVQGADTWKIVLHTCIRAPFQRKLLLPRKLFQKPHRNPLSSVCGFSHESNIKKPEPKRMKGSYTRHDFMYVICLLLSTNRGHLLNGGSSEVSLSNPASPQDL